MRTVVKAVIKKGDKFLIFLRSKHEQPMPLHWDFTGGKLEQGGEDPISGLKREVYEETRLRIGSVSLDWQSIVDIEGKPFTFMVYKVDMLFDDSDIILNPNEYESYMWASKEEIATLKINPFINKYLKII